MPFSNLAVAEDIADAHQLLDQLDATLVIPGQIIAIGEVEGIDIPIVGIVALANDLERQLIGGGYLRATTLAMSEELLLSHLLSFGMVADEDDMHVVVFGPQEAHHPEVEAARDILLELAHRAAYVHHG